MKRYYLLILFLLGLATATQAQKYRTAAGARLDGNLFGVTVQQKILERSTIEGIFAVGGRELSATGLYEWHRPLLGKRFNYYLGGGAHVGNLKDHGVFTGVDAILGVEYKVNGLPFLLSADLKPAVHINHEDWAGLSSGVSIRYVILAEKKEKKSWWPFGKKEEETKKKQQSEETNIFDKIFKKPEPVKEEETNPLKKIFRKREE
ncbi:hypothetical protein [Botryobacter ruber]|uniref:hypothetical protein n=1 Tax=Botryobacter ruber TaxID=2171629 RepID=UPI000E0C322A|nr:hypothetical protein [Botryobacter ruber]